MAMFLKFLSKYWPILALLLLGFLYGHWQYERGYKDRDYLAVQEADRADKAKIIAVQDQATADHNALVVQQKDYENQMAALKARQDAANAAVIAAEGKADDLERQRNLFYQNWQQEIHNVTLAAPQKDGSPGINDPFTIGFVGLYNIAIVGAISGSTTPDQIGLADIVSAAGTNQGSGPLVVSAPSGVTFDDLLTVEGHNGQIMKQCLDDREIFKQWIGDLVAKGVVQLPQ